MEKKIYVESDDLKKLQDKAEGMGIVGRGWLSHFLTKIANQDMIILDENVKKAIKLKIDILKNV